MTPPAALRLGVVVLLLLAAPAARAQDLDPAPWAWADGKKIISVIFEPPLQTMPPAEALGMIETRPGAMFQSETLSTDLGRLYRSGRFGSPLTGEHRGKPAVEVVVRPDGGGVIVEFTVHERPRALLKYEGVEDVDDDWLEESVKVKDGDLLDPFGLERSVRALRQKLIDEGHLHAEVASRVEPAPGREEVDAFITVRAGPKVYIDEIVWDGAVALDPDDLQGASGPDAMQTKPRELWGLLEKGTYKPEVFRQDLERVARYYRSQGWLDVKVYTLEERYAADGAALTLVVGVEEGDRYHVRRVGVEGTTVLSEDRLLREVPLRSGRPFLGEDLRGAIDRIRRLYGQRAYIHCDVDVDVRYDAEKKLLDVTLRVSEGPKVRIEEIRIDGNDKTQEKVVRRELSVYPGEYYDADQLEASVNRLGRLRYFQDVRLDFAPGSQAGSEHLLIHVEEARTGAIIVGGGVSTAAGFFGNITLTQRNFDLFDPPDSFRDFIEGRAFTGAGQQLTLTLQPGRQRSQYSIEFVEPWLLGFPVILELEAFARDRQREDWLETRRGGRATLGYRLTQDLIVRASYRFERVRIADIDASAVPDVLDVAGTNYVGTLRLSASYDQNRYDGDQVLHGGYALSSYYEVADHVLASDFDFQRAGGAANWQVTFFEWPRRYKWVAGLRADLGWIEERHRSDSVPIFERFFAGGPGSVRGFQFRSVSPQQFDKPLGGSWLGVVTAEASFPLFQSILRGVVFADAGGAVARFSDFERDDNIRVAAGFGFRLRVPVFPAPVALDFAWPLRKRRDDDPQIFSFSVGFGF